jgi:hypothetical protein
MVAPPAPVAPVSLKRFLQRGKLEARLAEIPFPLGRPHQIPSLHDVTVRQWG